MEIKSETEPGQELPSQKSSHESSSEPSHEQTADDHGSDQKTSKRLANSTIPDEPNHRSLFSPVSTTSYQFIGDLFNAHGEAIFVDGSRYRGTWDSLGMAGAGSYRMPHDVIYDGEMRDGMQHGQGSLVYPGKQVIDGVWNRGELEKWKYTFSDGLVFESQNWTYCQFPDRRFQQSRLKGLNPAGRSLKTQDQPTKVIPSGCYDSGDGIFDPSTLCVTNFDQPSKTIRIPSRKEIDWITKRCRKGDTEPTGYRPSLNENWSSNPPELPYRLPMSKDSPERWWKRVFTFEKDPNVILEDMRRSLRLERGEGLSSSLSDAGSKGRTECLCKSEQLEPEPEPEAETEFGYDVCGDFDDVCGLRSSEESSTIEIDALREVICEKMTDSGEEWGGEDADDLLMTVCCPPKDTMIIRRRRRSTKNLDDRRVQGKECIEKEEEEEEEFEEQEDSMEGSDSKEGIDYWDEKEFQEYYDQMFWEKSTKRDDDSGAFVDGIGRKSKSSKKPVPRKLRPGRAEKTKTVVKAGPKRQKKRPCPPVIDTEQLLQRKVGDLLFSPALEAPRSPVYLVRKECDKKSCRKLRPRKFDVLKCGVSVSPANFPAKKPKPRICKEDKKLREKIRSDNKHICSNSTPFITISNDFSRDKSEFDDKKMIKKLYRNE